MSFFGKLLVVFNLVMSILFMCFAGAVWSAHKNWRATAMKTADTLKTTTNNLNLKTKELEDLKTQSTKTIDEQKNLITSLEGNVGNLSADNKLKETEIQRLRTEIATQTQLAQVAGEASQARLDESLKLREINQRLLTSRNDLYKERSKLVDDLQALSSNLELAGNKNRAIVQQLATMQRVLQQNGLKASPEEIVAAQTLPPSVEGEISSSQTGANGGAELVEITLGKDDGLVEGHELTVYRPGTDGGQGKYLGKIRISRTYPDRAVAIVVTRAGNGSFAKGDHVTSKF